MKTLISIPEFKALIRKEYLYDLTKGHGEYVEAIICAVKSIAGRALTFSALLDSGALFSGLPVSAIVSKPLSKDTPDYGLDYLSLWDCLSNEIDVEEINVLSEHRCRVIMKNKRWEFGEYAMSFTWGNSFWATDPVEDKVMNLIALDNGQYAIQPNNRCLFMDMSFTPHSKQQDKLDYMVNTHVWRSETSERWATEDSQAFQYEMKEANHVG